MFIVNTDWIRERQGKQGLIWRPHSNLDIFHEKETQSLIIPLIIEKWQLIINKVSLREKQFINKVNSTFTNIFNVDLGVQYQ